MRSLLWMANGLGVGSPSLDLSIASSVKFLGTAAVGCLIGIRSSSDPSYGFYGKEVTTLI